MSNFSNVSLAPAQASPLSTEALTAVTVLHVAIFLVGTVGNATVCVVSFFGGSARKIQRTPIKVFLANLSVADLFTLLISVPVALVQTWVPSPWIFGAAMCKLQPLAERLFYHASVLTVVVIAVERYQAIFSPLKIKHVKRRPRTAAILVSIWIISLTFSIPFTLLATFVPSPDGDICEFRADCLGSKIFYVVVSVLFFFVPFLVLAVVYVAILRRLRRAAAKRNGTLQGRRGEMKVGSSHGQPTEVIILFLSFLICLLPHRTVQLWLLFAPNDEIEKLGAEKVMILVVFLRTAVYAYCTINPALYNLFASEFKVEFEKFRRLRVTRRSTDDRLRVNDIEMTCYRSADNAVWSRSNHLRRLQCYTVSTGRYSRFRDGSESEAHNTHVPSVRHPAQYVWMETCC